MKAGALKVRVQELIRFWQGVLDLRDLYVDLVFSETPDAEQPKTFAAIDQSYLNDNGRATLTIYPPAADLSPFDLATTVGHELTHVLLWPLDASLRGLGDHLAPSQVSLVKNALYAADESVTCRLERIFANHVRIPKELLTDLEDDSNVQPKRKKRLRRSSLSNTKLGIGFHADA